MNSTAARRVEDFQRQQDRELAQINREQGRPPSLSDLRAINEMRNQNAQLFKNLELQLPQPQAADDAQRYEARLLDELKRHSPKWRSTDMLAMARANALGAVRGEIRSDATRVCDDVMVGSFRSPGALRKIEKVDAAGQKIIEWHGPTWFGATFQLPFHQAIVAFGDGKGRWFDTGGEITGRRR